MGVFAVDFRGRVRNWWVYWSVIGHRLRVGAAGVKGKAQKWCKLVWTGVEMWERGLDHELCFVFAVDHRRRDAPRVNPELFDPFMNHQ
jgi:hypothetical protein